MALSTVTCARNSICGRFRQYVQANYVGLYGFVRHRLANRRRLARADLDRRFCFLQDTIIRLHANVREGQEGVRANGPRVLRGRNVRPGPMRVPGRFLHFYRFLVFRSYVSDCMGARPVWVYMARRNFGIFREVSNDYAHAGAEYASVRHVNAVVGNFRSALRILYQDGRFSEALSRRCFV